MKYIFTATIKHLRTSFSPVTYALCFIVIAAACWFNYFTVYKLWPVVNGDLNDFFFLWLLFTVFFFSGYIFTPGSRRKKLFLKYGWVIFIGPLIFALKVTLPYSKWMGQLLSPSRLHVFYQPVAWTGGLLLTLLSLFILHWIRQKKYGLFYIKRSNNYSVYFALLLLMLPLLVLAAAQPTFQEVYPKSKIVLQSLNTSTNVKDVVLFEFAYMLDFITIELFFRGMLIALLSRALGVHCIIPVALFYFSIHLGKPMLEAVSSFFGGLILGAISFETKSIWGGWVVHCGIALCMELLGFIYG